MERDSLMKERENARRVLGEINTILSRPRMKIEMMRKIYNLDPSGNIEGQWRRQEITAIRSPFAELKPGTQVNDGLSIVIRRREPSQRPVAFLGLRLHKEKRFTQLNLYDSRTLFGLLEDPDIVDETGWRPGQEIIIPEVQVAEGYFALTVELYARNLAGVVLPSQIFEVGEFFLRG